jgi:hypothetical protein
MNKMVMKSFEKATKKLADGSTNLANASAIANIAAPYAST